jgi:hypothetical protein
VVAYLGLDANGKPQFKQYVLIKETSQALFRCCIIVHVVMQFYVVMVIHDISVSEIKNRCSLGIISGLVYTATHGNCCKVHCLSEASFMV